MESESAAKSEFEPPKYLASLIAAVNDGAKAAQGGALLFMLVGLYLLATAFSASDEDLLRAKTLTIVQIGAALPVSFSFAIAPLVFVFLHIYTLVRYDMLAANVRQFRKELKETVEIEADRERCRQLLANVEFVGALTTPHRSPLYSWLWSWLFIGIVAVFPVAVLLLVQINALRYQSELVTIVQRVWLMLDLMGLVWFFARDPLSVGGAERAWVRQSAVRRRLRIGLPALLIGLNSLWLGTAPPDADPRLVRYDPKDDYWNDHSKPWLAGQPLDLWTCPRLNWGCRFLRVDRRTLVDKVWDDKRVAELRTGSSTDEAKAKAVAGIDGLVLRGRSLRFAVLDESRLYAADLTGADMRHASLIKTNLPGARLLKTQLQGADLRFAQLERADLTGAQLERADLTGAQLERANLERAQLQGASLNGAQLQDASLSRARLQSALLSHADLKGADLRRAELWHATTVDGSANFTLADLRGADFGTPLTKKQQAELAQVLALIPSDYTRRLVEKRLQEVLEQEGPAPQFALTADSSLPVLADALPDRLLTAHLSWLISAPMPFYNVALADYLVGTLASRDPAIAASIATRALDGLHEEQVRPIAYAIACRLLATRGLGLKQESIDELIQNLNGKELTCPAAPSTTSKTK